MWLMYYFQKHVTRYNDNDVTLTGYINSPLQKMKQIQRILMYAGKIHGVKKQLLKRRSCQGLSFDQLQT
jgi:hypothetical protein